MTFMFVPHIVLQSPQIWFIFLSLFPFLHFFLLSKYQLFYLDQALKIFMVFRGVNFFLKVFVSEKMKPTHKCQQLQFLKWPFEAVSKSKSIPFDPHVKVLNFTAEVNIFTAWYKKGFWSR